MFSDGPENAGLAVGVAVGVGLGVRLGVAVGVGVGVAVGVRLGVGVAVGVGLGVAVGVAVGGTGGTGSGGEPRNSSSAAKPAATSTTAHRTAISHFRGLRSLRPEGDGEKPSPKKGSAPNEAKSSCWSAPCSILPDGESGIENSTFSSVGRLSSGGKNQSDTFFTPEFACMATRRLFHFQKPKPPKSWLPDGLPLRAGERPELAP